MIMLVVKKRSSKANAENREGLRTSEFETRGCALRSNNII